MLSVNNVTKSFGDISAVNALSFDVHPGEIVGLLGPNGAGKSTTMRIMSGYLLPDSGDVTLDTVSILEHPYEVQKRIGYLPENNPLYNDMLVSELLNLSAGVKGLTGSKLTEALNFVVSSIKIADVFYRPIRELSKGYKQRVGIGIALLHRPQVLILDEPTEGLDPNQRTETRSLIKELAKDRTVIISTHVMQEVEALCTRVVLINKGKKVADGGVAELLKSSKGGVLDIILEGDRIREELKALNSFADITIQNTEGNKVYASVSLKGDKLFQPELSKLAADKGWVIWGITERKQQLEDVFKELTK